MINGNEMNAEVVIVFIFKIQNKFEEYADCAKFIHSVKNKTKIQEENFTFIPWVFIDEEKDENASIEIIRANKILNSKPEKIIYPSIQKLNSFIASKNKKAFHFIVSIDENMGDDIVGLQYYYLLRQNYLDNQRKGEISLLVKTPTDKSLIFKISHYLSLEIRKDRESILYEEDGVAIHLPFSRIAATKMNITKLRNFFPLLEITNTSYEIVSKSIGNIIQSTFDDLSPRVLPNNTGLSIYRENQKDRSKVDLQYLLLSNTIAMLNSNQIKKDLRIYFFQPDFFELIRDLPLLMLMLFAVAIKENKELPYDIQIAIYEATDYAEGILQLLDNMVEHSQMKKGYFSFRIHHTDVSNENGLDYEFSNKYLSNSYNGFSKLFLKRIDEIKGDKKDKNEPEDLEIQYKASKNKYEHEEENVLCSENGKNIDSDEPHSKATLESLSFLELFVIDTIDVDKIAKSIKDRSPVYNVFYKNIEKRIEDGEDLNEYLSSIKNVQLSEFFDRSSNLSDYEADYRNITRHYGLKRFSNSVSSARGFLQAVSTYKFFGVNSHTSYRQEAQSVTSTYPEYEKIKTIPGTKYQVLLPLNQRNYYQKFVGIDKNLKWMEKMDIYLSDKWIEVPIFLKSNNCKKIERIAENGKEIIEIISKNNIEIENDIIPIYVLNILENIKANNLLNAEYICKSILYALSNEDIKVIPKIYIVVRNCPKHFIPEFIHNMMIAYDRYNFKKREIMKERQIYCCGTDPFDDVLVMGENLKEMRQYLYNRSLLRGAFPSFQFLINFIMGKQDSLGNINETKEISIDEIPFDLILKDDGKTLFEKRTKIILEKRISENELGCKISDLHIQIGSKIHLHNFFDAEILFQSSYFTTRFAALIAKDVGKKILKDSMNENCSYKLIGYGNYSEMVVSQTQKLMYLMSNQGILGKTFSITPYSIVDANDNNNSDNLKTITESRKNSRDDDCEKFIFIVPINSTLTTHNKLHSFFVEFLGKDDTCVLGDYALVLVRDTIEQFGLTILEKQFWDKVENNLIYTRLISSPVTFFIEIPGKWEDPLSCSLCFPCNNFSDEQPVVETNITSVIPMLQLENSFEADQKFGKKDIPNLEDIDNPLRIDELSTVATYKHINREGNHYLFYFSPEKLIKKSYNKIKNWLLGIKPKIICSESQNYNFLVAPLTESNTGLIELINEIIFENSAQILRFEINREYRNNFISKFSYISELYNNLKQTNTIWSIKTRINFYFVDDGIITGRTIERAKSLINSLFPDISQKVKVSIFEGIFVLINRLSKDSIKNYIEDDKRYYFYSNFPISSIRNSSNFCYLCKLSEDGKLLSRNSSLNDMQKVWGGVGHQFEPVNSSDLDLTIESDRKSINRIICAGNLAQIIKKTEVNKYHLTKGIVFSNLLREISNFSKYEEVNEKNILKVNIDSLAILESYMKLLSRPFFIYKFSIRKTLLDILVTFLDIFISSISFPQNNRLDQVLEIERSVIISEEGNYSKRKEKIISRWIINILQDSDANKVWFFDLIMEQFSELYSTRILRKDFLLFIARLCAVEWFTHLTNQQGITPLIIYRKAISKITNLSRDESKSMWLEYLLVKGIEYQDRDYSKSNQSFSNLWNSSENLGLGLYIENTKVIRDALQFLARASMRNSNNVLDEKEYYLDNFRRLLEINGIICKDKDKRIWNYKNFRIKKFSKENLLFDVGIFNSLIQNSFNFNDYSNSDNINNESESDRNEGLRTNEMECEYSYAEIISSMINLQRFLNEKSITALYDNKEILLADFYFICESINNLSMGVLTDIILVPPEQNFTNADSIVVFTRAISKKWVDILHKPVYSKEDFDEGKFVFETFYNDKTNGRIIVKIIDGKDNQRIFFAINYSPESKKNSTVGMEYAFTIRNVLLFRGQIKELIEKHINGNSLQSWANTNQKEYLLENIKHIRHTDFDSSLFENYVNKLIIPPQKEIKPYIYSMQATVLKLLADINISSIYHDAIVSPDEEFDDVDVNISYWNPNSTLSALFNQDVIKALIPINSNANRIIDWKIPNISVMANYYLKKSSEGLLILVSFIENSIKFSPENGNLSFSVSPFTEGSKLHYFCITNDLKDSYSTEQDMKKLDEQLQECLLYPVEERWNGIIYNTETQNDIGGVSLFAANHYCKRLLSSLGYISNINQQAVINYSFTTNKNTNRIQITIRIPILYIDVRRDYDFPHS